jgi:hypothetical protein
MRGAGDAKAKPAVDVSTFVAGLKDALPAIEADAAANDPKALRAEIARLRGELARNALTVDVAAIEQKAYARGHRDGVAALTKVRRDWIHLAAIVATIGETMDAATQTAWRAGKEAAPVSAAHGGGKTADAITAAEAAQSTGKRVVFVAPSNGALPAGEKAVLAAIAQYPNGLRREQLTVLTGYKRSSRDQYIARLRQRGHIEVRDDRVLTTPNGIQALGAGYKPPRRGEALRLYVLETLPEGERKVLSDAIFHYPAWLARDAISEATGYKRSSRDQYISRLRARELIAVSKDGVKASETLFMEAA